MIGRLSTTSVLYSAQWKTHPYTSYTVHCTGIVHVGDGGAVRVRVRAARALLLPNLYVPPVPVRAAHVHARRVRRQPPSPQTSSASAACVSTRSGMTWRRGRVRLGDRSRFAATAAATTSSVPCASLDVPIDGAIYPYFRCACGLHGTKLHFDSHPRALLYYTITLSYYEHLDFVVCCAQIHSNRKSKLIDSRTLVLYDMWFSGKRWRPNSVRVYNTSTRRIVVNA